MKRYIADIKALEVVKPNETFHAWKTLASDRKITDETLVYNSPNVSIVLADEEVNILKSKGIRVCEEKIQYDVKLNIDEDYERNRTAWRKMQLRGVTGKGVNVASLDSGCNTTYVPAVYKYNFIDDTTTTTDVLNHGTGTASIIKHAEIGGAPGCNLFALKMVNDNNSITESAALAAIDFCADPDNDIDIVSISFQFNSTAFDAAVIELAATNCVVVAAAGNAATMSTIVRPAALDGVLAITELTEDGKLRALSVIPESGGHGITACCNGAYARICTNNGQIGFSGGTSFCAPYFAFEVALFMEYLKTKDKNTVLNQIKNRCIKVDGQYTGWGQLNN